MCCGNLVGKHAGEFVCFYLKCTALLGYVPAIDWRIRLLLGVIFIEPSTPTNMLRPWSGRSSQVVDNGMCAGATFELIHPVLIALVQSAISLCRLQSGPLASGLAVASWTLSPTRLGRLYRSSRQPLGLSPGDDTGPAQLLLPPGVGHLI